MREKRWGNARREWKRDRHGDERTGEDVVRGTREEEGCEDFSELLNLENKRGRERVSGLLLRYEHVDKKRDETYSEQSGTASRR